MKRKFRVLYTHQKAKKQKVWQDGWLTLSVDAKRGFLSTEDKRQISTVYLEKKEVASGLDLESDRYLIQVEEEIAQAETSCNSSQSSQPFVSKVSDKSVSFAPTTSNETSLTSSQPLKRKFSVPRRALPKQQPAIVEEKQLNHFQDLAATGPSVSIWNEIKSGDSVSNFATRAKPSVAGPTLSSTPTYRGTQDILNLLSGSTTSARVTEEVELKSDQHDSSLVQSLISTGKQRLFSQSYHSQHLSTDEPIVLPGSIQVRIRKEIFFPSAEDLETCHDFIPASTTTIPVSYESIDEYVQIWNGIINESINLNLWRKSTQYHKIMRNADISTLVLKRPELKYFDCGKSHEKENSSFDLPGLVKAQQLTDDEVADMDAPYCEHEAPCRVARVRKEGPNTGRLFYACRKGKRKCKFFQWVDDAVLKQKAKTNQEHTLAEDNVVKINNTRALTSYLNRNKVNLFVDCQIERKNLERPLEEKNKKIEDELIDGKRQTILKLSRIDQSLGNTKGSVWILSRSLEFNTGDSILIRVVSNNQSATGELVVQPIRASIPIEWLNQVEIHAMFVANNFLEFSYLTNLQRLRNLPILPQLLNDHNTKQHGTGIKPLSHKSIATFDVNLDEALKVVNNFAEKFKLSDDQTSILCSAAEMMIDRNNTISPLLVVDGVAGSGKTLLLAVVALLVFELLSTNQSEPDDECRNVIGRKRKFQRKWKILITSQLDSVVDHVIYKLVELGFPHVVRVGDLNKIDRKLLPHSLHIRGGSDEHVKKLKLMLRHCAESDPERQRIQKSLDSALSGGTKRLLHNAFVVGTTCRDALAPSIGYYKFPVIIMDDATMVSEPVALSPLTRFSCEKLLIAGDSRTLSLHNCAIKRPLYQRLLDSGNDVFHLHTHYRCHPHVVALLNSVVYDDTVTKASSEVKSLIPGLPGVCFCDVIGREENSGDSSQNHDQADFSADTVKLLLSHGVPGTSVAVMTTHDEQVSAITSAMQKIEFYDLSDVNCIKVGTFPAMAADEFDVVIISCVQNSSACNDRTTSDVIRMLTRARNHVIVVASLRHLVTNPLWSRALEFCKKNKNQVTSTFHFRKLLQKKIASGENLCDELPLVAEHTDVIEEHVMTSQSSQDEDAEEEFFSHLKRREVALSSGSDDDIPVLRHKRPKFDDEITKNDKQVESCSSSRSISSTDRAMGDDVKQNSDIAATNDVKSQHHLSDVTVDDVKKSQEFIDDAGTDVTYRNNDAVLHNDVTYNQHYEKDDDDVEHQQVCDDVTDADVEQTPEITQEAEFNAGSIFTIADCDLTLDRDDISLSLNDNVTKSTCDVTAMARSDVVDSKLVIAMPEVLEAT